MIIRRLDLRPLALLLFMFAAAPAGAVEVAVLTQSAFAAPPSVFIARPAPEVRLTRKTCSLAAPDWAKLDADNKLTIDLENFSPGWITLDFGDCAEVKELVYVFLTDQPRIEKSDAVGVVHAESRIAEVTGNELQAQELVAFLGDTVASALPCVGRRTCALSVPKTFVVSLLEAEGGQSGLVLLPGGLSLATERPLPQVLIGEGLYVSLTTLAIDRPTVEFARPLLEPGPLQASGERALVKVPFLEAFGDVSCRNARCALSNKGIEVFAIDASSLSIRLRVDLKPNALRRIDGRAQTSETYELNVVRCGLKAPDVPLLAGASDHRYFVALARECLPDPQPELRVETRPATYSYVKSELESPDPAWRIFEIVFDKVPEGEHHMRLTLGRREPIRTTLGAINIEVRTGFRPLQIRIEVPDLGLLDFIPENREANLNLVYDDPRWERDFTISDRPGFYAVSRDGDTHSIRAVPGAIGTVPLRFAYNPPELTTMLGRVETLTAVDSEARYPLRKIHVPLPLEARGFVRARCGNAELLPGKTLVIPYRERVACRLILDLEAIPEWAGDQRLHVQSTRINEIITVSHRSGFLTIPIPAIGMKEFDVLTIAVGHDYGSAHYDFSPRQNLGAEARFLAVLGDRKFRVTVSTSLPTGLFRFGGSTNRGSVPLSAGGIARIVWLYNEGNEFPFGLEFGLLGTGLSAEPHLSMVTGIGFSVPVLNANTPLQTTFNLHAWLEFSPTRSNPGENPWAFLFGPSFGVGRFSANL